MAANGSYNSSNNVLTVTGDGLPTPVNSGTFPNANNSNTITSYAFNHNFVYRGGSNTSDSGIVGLGAIGIAANGVIFFNPSAGTDGSPPSGFSYVAAGIGSAVNYGEDSCGGYPESSGQYRYNDSDFIDCWNANQVMAGYNDYYGSSQYNGDNIRHPDGHSKIIGYCFDGYPVYGPYGYTDANDNTTPVIRMSSGWTVRVQEAPGRPVYDTTYPAGVFMEDYEYTGGTGKLDTHNGRHCVTPEYPSGTFAYFLTEDNSGNPVFPFMMGLTSKEAMVVPANDGFTQTAPPTDDGGDTPDQPPTLVITSQPTNATVQSGNLQQFSLLAEIQPQNDTIAYQWQVSTDGGFAWSNLTGNTSATLNINAQPFMTGYRYRCVLTGPVGASTQAQNSPLISNLAILTVTGTGTSIDYASILKFDSGIGKYDMTPVNFDRDNNNPDFTIQNFTLDNSTTSFDMT